MTRNDLSRHLLEHGVVLPPAATTATMEQRHSEIHDEIDAERALITGMCAADEHKVDHPQCNVCRLA